MSPIYVMVLLSIFCLHGRLCGILLRSRTSESTSAPWVILVINVNISLVGLTLLPSMFQISSTMEWHGLEDVEPLQNAEDKGLAQAQSTRLYIFILVIQDHIESIGKPIL